VSVETRFGHEHARHRFSIHPTATIFIILALSAIDGIPVSASTNVANLSGPQGIVAAGSKVWVTNSGNNSVTELNAFNGSVVRIIKARGDFNTPESIAASAKDVWVANIGNSSVTELEKSNGSVVRVIRGKSFGIDFPLAMCAFGSHVWIANGNGGHGNSITEINASNGSLVRVIKFIPNPATGEEGMIDPNGIAVNKTQLWVTTAEGDPLIEFSALNGSELRIVGTYLDAPEGVVVNGSHVWVTNLESHNAGLEGSVTELNALSGSLVQVFHSPADGFNGPEGIAISGADVWVLNTSTTVNTDSGPWSITELNSSDGRLVRVIRAPKYGFDHSSAIAAVGSKVWVTNGGSDTVTELSSTDGSLIRIVK
jgi:DNA-binding beta-propeller fold protein YncE